MSHLPPCKVCNKFSPKTKADLERHMSIMHSGTLDPLKRAMKERDLYRARAIDELIVNLDLDRMSAAFQVDLEVIRLLGNATEPKRKTP